MTRKDWLDQMRRYVNRNISFEELETWVLSGIQAALDTGDAHVIKIMNALDGLLLELSDGIIGDDEFSSELLGLLESRKTIPFEIFNSERREESPATTDHAGTHIFDPFSEPARDRHFLLSV